MLGFNSLPCVSTNTFLPSGNEKKNTKKRVGERLETKSEMVLGLNFKGRRK